MTTSRKIVIKINQSLLPDTQEVPATLAKDEIRWNWRRVIGAMGALIVLLVLLIKLMANDSSQEMNASIITPETNINQTGLLPAAIAASEKVMPQKPVQLTTLNSISNSAKAIEKLKKPSAKPHKKNKNHNKHT